MIIYNYFRKLPLVIGAHVFHCSCVILDTPLIRATAHEISSDFAKISMRFLEISRFATVFPDFLRFPCVFRDFQISSEFSEIFSEISEIS